MLEGIPWAKEGERVGGTQSSGRTPWFCSTGCVGAQSDGSTGTQGDIALSIEGPDFIKAAYVPCDVETESHLTTGDTEGLHSEDATSSEHSGLKTRKSFLQASCKLSPNPRLWCNPMRKREPQ